MSNSGIEIENGLTSVKYMGCGLIGDAGAPPLGERGELGITRPPGILLPKKRIRDRFAHDEIFPSRPTTGFIS